MQPTSAPVAVGLAPLTAAGFAALLDGDLSRAGAAAGVALTGYFVTDRPRRTWRRRVAQLSEDPSSERWLARIARDRSSGAVVGFAGFHGPPDAGGMVEVSYSVDPVHRRRGYARAMLGELLRWAAAEPAVRTVRATISPDNAGSLATVAGFGFVRVGEQWDDEDGLEIVLELPAANRPPLLAITGAAGYIGGVLRRGLVEPGAPVSLLDRAPMRAAHPGERIHLVDLADTGGLAAGLAGADCVIHLAGVPHEDEFEVLLENNIAGTEHVFEAARLAGARRVVFASSIHVNGFHPADAPLSAADPLRPDTRYGVGKIFGEALGRLYADRYGLEVVCLRICTCSPRPTDHQGLATWLSPGDTVRLFRAATTAAGLSYLVAYGVSANTRRRIAGDGWDVLGYVPQDDAERFADRVGPPSAAELRFVGSSFTDADLRGAGMPPPPEPRPPEPLPP